MKKILFGILLAVIGGFLVISSNDDIGFWVGRLFFLASIIFGITGLNDKDK